MMNFKYFYKTLLKCFYKLFKCIFIALILIFLVLIYPVFIEPNLLIVKHEKLYLPNYNDAHNGLKIAILSDLHLSKYCINMDRLKTIVDKTNKEKVDFIFILGDLDSYLIERNKFNPDEISGILSKLNSKYGVFAVLGNHDFGHYDVKSILLNADIKVLENQKIIKNVSDKQFIIYGLKDMWHYNPNPMKLIRPINPSSSFIVLSHNPDLFPNVPDFVSLTLSGHTHGGQICIPILGGIFTPSIWEQRYNKGYIVENNKHLFVTSGLGFSVPLRLGNPPEIVILELYSQKTYPEKIIENTKPLKGIKHSLNAIGCSFAEKFLSYFKLW